MAPVDHDELEDDTDDDMPSLVQADLSLTRPAMAIAAAPVAVRSPKNDRADMCDSESANNSDDDMPALLHVPAEAVAHTPPQEAVDPCHAHHYDRRDTLASSGPGRRPMEAQMRGAPGQADAIAERPLPVGSASTGGRVNIHSVITDEQADELGYPTIPEEMKDPDFFKRDFLKMSTDPRYNRNLLLDRNSQEYWNEAARAPWAKTLLRREQYWNDRRQVWVYQADRVAELNNSREVITDLLEDCGMDVKRLVSPIIKYRIVELKMHFLNAQAKELGLPFQTMLLQDGVMSELQLLRRVLDAGGEAEAQRLLDAFDALVKRAKEDRKKEVEDEARSGGRVVMDAEGLRQLLDHGHKCKTDGLIEWKKENYEEALASWRQGDNALRKFRAPGQNPKANAMLMELHGMLLKNKAQAAIKLEAWSDALDAAERALEIEEEDHKAWFRKACALEGFGRFEEASQCLSRVQEIAVGRPDRDRICKDVDARRAKLQLLKEHNEASQHRMLQQSLRKGVFSLEREQIPEVQPRVPLLAKSPAVEQNLAGTSGPDADKMEVPKPKRILRPQVKRGLKPGEKRSATGDIVRVDAAVTGTADAKAAFPHRSSDASVAGVTDKRLTKDGADDILDDLEALYTDPWFTKRVDKIALDVRCDPEYFLAGLSSAALEVTLPVLEKWGFEPSKLGAMQLLSALQEHTSPASARAATQSTRESRCSKRLCEKQQRVAQAMYGAPQLRMVERVQALYALYEEAGHKLHLPAPVMPVLPEGQAAAQPSVLGASPSNEP